MKYADFIKHERMKRGWSQGDLAEKSGLHVQTIKNVERNRKTRPSNLRRLADAFSAHKPIVPEYVELEP